MEPPPEAVTRLLHELKANPEAASRLVPLIYQHLHRLAASFMRGQRPDHTLQATLLADEAYLRLTSQEGIDCENRVHFFGFAARVMRNILVDHARSRQRQKRGGKDGALRIDQAVESAASPKTPVEWDDLIELNEALDSLERIDPQQAQVVDLLFFGGLTEEEAANAIGISARTVRRELKAARRWLWAELSGRAGKQKQASSQGGFQQNTFPED